MLSENGLKVFNKRLATKDETFEQAVNRLCRAVGNTEYQEILLNRDFVPSTPIWSNIGKKRMQQPGACFVLPVEDDLGDMYQTLKDTAMVFKYGGGVGYNFSNIRPRGAAISTTNGEASGVVELIRLYDASSVMVKQGGIRRGASMGILNVDHPEIVDFIDCKLDGSLENFNLSVGITDEFMNCVEERKMWTLQFNGTEYKTIPARELWDKITYAAWKCGDPGIIFLDAINKDNLLKQELTATNPCGEQPLLPWESCLLGSVNLKNIIKDGKIDYHKLEVVTRYAVQFLDDLIDIAEYPLKKIEEMTKYTRRIGIGITGLHDLLIQLGIPYDSAAGRSVAKGIMVTIRETADKKTEELAFEYGAAPAMKELGIQRRNTSCITIAPTGSVSLLADCEGYGIEPVFGSYTKHTEALGDLKIKSEHDVKTAQQIEPLDHLLMQAAVQEHVDNAVSKTINLSADATQAKVSYIYARAHDLGLKGITIYREGSKDGVVDYGEASYTEVPARGEVVKRPAVAEGKTYEIYTGCGKLYLTINYHNGVPIETFITTGSKGGCQIYTEATSRLISMALRGGISVDDVVKQLKGTNACSAYVKRGTSPGKSCASAIGKMLEGVVTEVSTGICPECGHLVDTEAGCRVCTECGWSKC